MQEIEGLEDDRLARVGDLREQPSPPPSCREHTSVTLSNDATAGHRYCWLLAAADGGGDLDWKSRMNQKWHRMHYLLWRCFRGLDSGWTRRRAGTAQPTRLLPRPACRRKPGRAGTRVRCTSLLPRGRSTRRNQCSAPASNWEYGTGTWQW